MVLFAHASDAATWYVSTSGNDAASGSTPDDAFATPARASDAAGIGDRIKVSKGTYFDTTLKLNGKHAETTWTGYGAVLSGGRPLVGTWSPPPQGLVPIYEYLRARNSDREYTPRNTPYDASWIFSKIAFYAFSQPRENTVPVYCFYHSTVGDHEYTLRSTPYDEGWSSCGVAFYVFSTQMPGTVPIRQYWSSQGNSHEYTSRTFAFDSSWTGNSVVWYAHLCNTAWSLALSADSPSSFNSLFVGGVRRSLAKSPNVGWYAYDNHASHTGIHVQSADVDAASWLAGETPYVILPGSWQEWHRQGVEFNSGHWIGIQQPVSWPFLGCFNSGNRFLVQNSFAYLDAPGEWYLDTSMRMVWYIPASAEEEASLAAGTLDVVVPVSANAVLRIDASANVTIQGFSIEHMDWDRENTMTNSGNHQSADFLGDAAVVLRNSSGCLLESVNVRRVGQYGIQVEQGSEHNSIRRCNLMDLGAGGVRLSDGSSSSVIEDCSMSFGSLVFSEGVGIFVQKSSHNIVAHNEVAHFRYTGINVGWTWDYSPSGSNNNTIEWNHVHDIGLGVLTDLAGIYTLGISPNTVIRSNLVHDTNAFAGFAHGIYLDQATSDVLVTGNVVYKTEHAGFYQHFGARNLITQNIFALATGGQGELMEADDMYNFGPSNLTFSQNIVYVDSKTPRIFCHVHGGSWTGDRNLFFDVSTPGLVSNTFPDPQIAATGGAEMDRSVSASLNRWRSGGADVNSIVADPKFQDPFNGNFRLSELSPAITQLDFDATNVDAVLSTAGPRPQSSEQSLQVLI
eukprot:TRINITY_DN56718_c0_g1_i1.p1 TRINITY_DN56718_c0_g1~~TRINITY_DN56718_c0_g1_i1.p1  ORF type:complete len:814 (+),score=98.02 TRINITY_DN56718_c0_g1_i1:68-2443(+)